MRYGVLSDVHGNLHALTAALALLSKQGVDGYICAGDLVGYGSLPNECIDALAGVNAQCVLGNHDLIALGRLDDDRCSALARNSLRWTQDNLSDASRAYLAQLPELLISDAGLVVAHGSLTDPRVYIRNSEQREAQLSQLERDHRSQGVLVLGHTHLPVAHAHGRGVVKPAADGSVSVDSSTRYLLNPGSVGQSRQRTARAQCMLLDLERGHARFYALRYDVGACRRSLQIHGLPTDSHHSKPHPVRNRWEAVRRRLHHA